jgi:hypothetical protein
MLIAVLEWLVTKMGYVSARLGADMIPMGM